MVRCKFKCDFNEVAGVGTECETALIKLSPVYDGNSENKEFFKYTPSGQINLQVVNPEAAKQLEVGKEYYIDFTPAE